MAKQPAKPKTSPGDVFDSIRRACELAQKCKDDGCDWPEVSSALGKLLGAMASMERRIMPGGSFIRQDLEDK